MCAPDYIAWRRLLQMVMIVILILFSCSKDEDISGDGDNNGGDGNGNGNTEQEPVFEDDFSSGNIDDNWIVFGEPNPPAIDAAFGSPAPALGNMGQISEGGGAVTKKTFDYSNGLSIEFDMFVESNPEACWIAGQIGIISDTNSEEDFPPQVINLRYGYSGTLCDNEGAIKQEGYLSFRVMAQEGGDVFKRLGFNEFLDNWHHYTIIIQKDGYCSLFIDGEPIYTSTKQINYDYINNPVILGYTSTTPSKVYHDNIYVNVLE